MSESMLAATLIDPTVPLRRRPRSVAHAVLAGLVALVLTGGVVAATTASAAEPVAPPAPALPVPAAPVPGGDDPPSCVGPACRGRSPHTTGCDRDAVTVGQSPLATRTPDVPPLPDETVVGVVALRWSPRCRAGWALAVATQPCALGSVVVRRDDGAEESRTLPDLTGGEPGRAYTAMIDQRPGAARLVGLVAPSRDGRALVRDSTGFLQP